MSTRLRSTAVSRADILGTAYWAMGLEPPITALISQRDPVEHARRRKPWTRAFSTTALKEYEPIIRKRAVQLCEALGNEKGSTDLARWFTYFTCVYATALLEYSNLYGYHQLRFHGRHGVRT